MRFNIDLPHDLNYYFMLLVVFLSAYWIAYIFKNLSNLLESQGVLKFAVIIYFAFAVIIVLVNNIDQMHNYWVSGAYLAGFMFRFFRNDY